MDLAAGRSVGLPRHYRPNRLRRFDAAVKRAANLPEDQLPTRPQGKRRKRNSAFDRRLDSLLAQRNAVGASLDIDPSLIAPRAVLEQVAAEDAAPDEVLLSWQRQCLGL